VHEVRLPRMSPPSGCNRFPGGTLRSSRLVSADTALLLEALTGWDAQIWLTLQAKWDLWHAMRARGNRPKVRPLRETA
jgi:plasmid maintenance system antidote protein VapI